MVIKVSPSKYKVSIIITTFNRRKKVLSALQSAFEQTYKDFEIILVDDGSTDKIESDISKLLKINSNFRYLKHSNRGTALSLNSGIQLSDGDYITFLDSDDLYEPDHIEKRVKYFENHDVDIIYTTAKIIGNKEDMYVPDARDTKKLIHINNCVIGATIFGKKSVFKSLGGFRNLYAYDYDFIERAKLKFSVKRLKMPTYTYYRNSPDSVLSGYKKMNFIKK
jgi:glycosyltransferase involved in cell wall biosynthesis